MLKRWNWFLLIATIILCVTIFYINFSFYAVVIRMAFFCGLLGLSLFFGIHSLLNKEKQQRMTFTNGGLIIFIIIIFIIAIPDYSYNKSQQIVTAFHLNENEVEEATISMLDHKAVPVDQAPSWLLIERFYYIALKITTKTKRVTIW